MLLEKLFAYRTKEYLEANIRRGICSNRSYLEAIVALEEKTSVFYVENLLKELHIEVSYEEIKNMVDLMKRNLYYALIGLLDIILIFTYLFSLSPLENNTVNLTEILIVLGGLLIVLVVLTVIFSINYIKELKLLLKIRKQLSNGPTTVLGMLINMLKK